jgi:hypothetical protein
MITKIPALVAAALILGSTSMVAAAPIVAAKHHPRHSRIMLLENRAAFATPPQGVGSYGGYSSDPHTRALELLSDAYPPGY